MPDFLDKLKIKRAPTATAPKAAASDKASFWTRKKGLAEPKSDQPGTSANTAKSLSWRKVAKEKPAIVPKLPDTSGPAPIIYELDTDSLLSGGRRKMAIGLLWQPRASGQKMHAQAKSASVGGAAFELSVLNADGAQVGFASKMDAHKDGMMAAATAIPRAFVGDTWLAAFVLPITGDQQQLAWWIVAQRDGLVYEDQLVRNEIEARENFIDLHDAPGWETVICPSSWQVNGAQDIALGYLIKPRTKGSALRSHSPVTIWAPPVIAAAVVLGGVFGGYIYWQNLQEQELLAEVERLQAEEMARLDALQIAPWEGMPGLQDGVIACATLISELQVNPPGWILQPVTCAVTPGAVSAGAQWTRQAGTMAKYLYSALEYRGLPAPQFDPTLQSASVSRSAGVQPHEWGTDLAPLDPKEMFSRLVHRFDSLALPLVLTAQTALPSANTAGAPTRRIWNYHSIELESSIFPSELISLIGDIPAVVPQTLTYTPGTQTWKLSAFIYHPPITQTS